MIVGLAGALMASVCYGFGSIVQATAVSPPTATGTLDFRVLARLVAHRRYLCGLGLDVVGFVAAIVALRSLPLFVVQAAVASSVGVTAVAATRLLHARLHTPERRALVALVFGLALLAAAGRPEHATELAEPGAALLIAASVALAATAVVAVTRSPNEHAAAVLAACAGAAFGAVGIAARGFHVPSQWTNVLSDPLLYAIVANGVLATLLFASALQRGRVTTVAGVTFAVETVVPAVVGVAWLGDHARAGMAPVAILGFGTTVVASVALARFVEPVTTAVVDSPAAELATE